MLNSQTVKQRYPLPRIDQLIDQLHGARYMSSLDLQQGYYQIKIAPEDVPKTAFITPFGQSGVQHFSIGYGFKYLNKFCFLTLKLQV
jgi:hypothetical protein